MPRRFLATLACLMWPTLGHAADCGDADTPCETAIGGYHMATPDVANPKGVVIHLHGGGGRGRGLLNSGLAKAALARGYVFVAPNGEHPENRWTRDWSVKAKGTSHNRDDKAFLREVLADARARGGVTNDTVLLAGFSRGGSMVWDIACYTPDFATAYAPLAGALWDDLPDNCTAPVRLFHTHGWNDRTVPLEGRSFRDGAVVQGDVWASLKILRATNGCDARQPERNSYEGDLWFRHWTDCAAGEIQLMLHKGGHGAPQGWSTRVMDWFENEVS
ncbi:polyhydroxybutyrate depolymerase [uncultured Tateyamaria sp.]|uniref:alpha/beta hydrolase family esterase n=1 Tax=uncultured Tateyamaria sp. TaxID=455651 RepID=UPI00261EFAD5|nr:polyhydroxybutyrate depolymerase [uncultured Tateyamaria sp.]